MESCSTINQKCIVLREVVFMYGMYIMGLNFLISFHKMKRQKNKREAEQTK